MAVWILMPFYVVSENGGKFFAKKGSEPRGDTSLHVFNSSNL